MPLVMAAGSFGGKKIAHEMTRGMGAKTGGLKGDIYGYGEDEASSLKKDLKSQMAVDPLKERGGFGKDLLSSYISAGMAGNLGGAKQLLKGDITGKEALLGTKDWKFGGVEGAKAGLGDLFGTKWGGEDVGAAADMPISADTEAYSPLHQPEDLLSQQINQEPYVFGSEYDDTAVSEEILPYAQGGQVPQQQLMQLLALAQMQQNNAYSGTALEETKQPSIANYFESKGKTLGGNNTQSLSQMLGR